MYYRLCHVLVSWDVHVGHYVSTAYCWSLSSDDVEPGNIYITKVGLLIKTFIGTHIGSGKRSRKDFVLITATGIVELKSWSLDAHSRKTQQQVNGITVDRQGTNLSLLAIEQWRNSDLLDINGAVWSVDLITWWRLTVSSKNMPWSLHLRQVTTSRDKQCTLSLLYLTMMYNNKLFYNTPNRSISKVKCYLFNF